MVVIDGVRYRREDAERRGLIEVPEPVKVDAIDPAKLAAFEAWVAAGSPVVPPLDTDRHSSTVVGGEAEVVEQGEVTLPTEDGPVPAAAEPDAPAPLSTESAAPKRTRATK
ncbi:hypothetical protein B0T42_10060 [Rathayibacter sp. VKM Ac-2630]|nr:hypothetical protein B0T42_10060 [Rathayibacter sp. VKM Ac-2630]